MSAAAPPPRGSVARLRAAKPADVRAIAALTRPLIERRILVDKPLVTYFEDVQEFLVALDQDDQVIGCAALHVMWDDLAEVRTVAVAPQWRRSGVGSQLILAILSRARQLELERVFCLTFEVEFFARHGFVPLDGAGVDRLTYEHMLASHDDGVKEFLDLAIMKPNTLGNTRMIAYLSGA